MKKLLAGLLILALCVQGGVALAGRVAAPNIRVERSPENEWGSAAWTLQSFGADALKDELTPSWQEQHPLEWYQQQAAHGDLAAQLLLARHYYEGNGVPMDDWMAATWFSRAAEQGSAEAQF
ncbi:MAG TPA: hypothetical protein P5559_12075, partial [Candidatus Limiplasma sp.]|nr:hypothetical protein [Candidatus Limiplasma sp.]